MYTFTEKALAVIRQIPPGKIMTYGQVATMAGSPRAARQVTRILHSMSSKYSLPWHRIVNIHGQIAVRDDESRFFQRKLLLDEGVEVDQNDQIDLARFRFDPNEGNRNEFN